MAIKEIHRDNRREDKESYSYKINTNGVKQELFVTDLSNPLFINFNYFNYDNGKNLRLNLTSNNRCFEILNNNNKIVVVSHNEIIDIQDNFKDIIEYQQHNLRPDLGEELVLTDDGKNMRALRKKHFIHNRLIDYYYEYDEKGRLITQIQDRYNSQYTNSDHYEYDDLDRKTRIIHKMLSNVIYDESIEYIEILDQEAINEFTKFFNLLGINRESLINELNSMDLSLYDNVEINDLRSVVK